MERMKMLWTEKYRPKRIADVVGQYNFTIDAESWIEQNNMPNVLLYGVAGVLVRRLLVLPSLMIC